MRGRKKEPDGRRVTVCIKVSEAEAADIDAARGSRSRSEWGRSALLAAASPELPDCLHRLPPGAWCKTCGRTKT